MEIDLASSVSEFFSAEVPAFTPIGAAWSESLPALPSPRLVPAGTTLIQQGHPVQTVSLVRTGLLKLTYLSSRGREFTVGLRSEGWYAGSASALLTAPSVYSVQAVTACTVSRIPVRDLTRYLKENSGMLEHFVESLCLEIASQARLQIMVMTGSAEDRLDHFMRERTAFHGARKVFDPLPALKQLELAQLLSISPEHLSRLMHKRKESSPQKSESFRDAR